MSIATPSYDRSMAEPGFQIRIVDQGWINPDLTEDFRTVGLLDLVIGGQQILTPDDGQELGISETALGLLRTLDAYYDPEEESWKQVPHGCGLCLMMGCPIGVQWRVHHDGDTVVISDVVRFPTTTDSDQLTFGDRPVRVPFIDYEREVVAFARHARSMFGDGPFSEEDGLLFLNEVDEWAPWSDFFDEFDRLLAR